MTRLNLSVVACAAALALTASAMTVAPATASAPSTSVVVSAASAAAPAAAAAEGRRKKTKLKVKVKDKRVVVLTKTKIKGKVNGPKRKVILQLKNSYGWKRVTANKSNKKGKFSLKVPTGWYGKKKLRIVVPAKNRFGKAAKYRKVKVQTDYAPLGKSKSWSRLSKKFRLRYNPCKSVSYQINPSNLPADGVALVNESIFRIEKASGLRYKYKGKTNAIPWTGGKGQLTKNANLGIAWTSPDVLPDLGSTSSGNVLGIGGVMQARPIKKLKTYESTKTGLSIDYTDDAVYGANRGFDNGASLGAVMTHELTHATGLGHTNGEGQLMRPFIEADRPSLLGSGDIKGLNTVGIDSGCLSRQGNARGVPVDVDAKLPFFLND